MPGDRRIKLDEAYGSLAFGSVAAGYATLKAVKDCVGFILFNSTDADVVVSLDGGTTDWASVPATTSFVANLGALGLDYSGIISVKQGSAAPTLGAVSASVFVHK